MTAVDPASSVELRPTLRGAATELHLSMSRDQEEQLLTYLSLMHRWNAVHNLSAAHDAGTLLQHMIDCLAIVRPLERHLGKARVRALDAGTGGGLPAVVVTIMLPDWTIEAVDAVGKKIAFVRQVTGELHLPNLIPIHGRLERVTGSDHDVIVSRALTSLRQMVDQTHHLLRPGGVWAAMKGKVPHAEIRQLPANCQLFHVEPLAVPGLGAERCLIWLKQSDQGSALGMGG